MELEERISRISHAGGCPQVCHFRGDRYRANHASLLWMQGHTFTPVRVYDKQAREEALEACNSAIVFFVVYPDRESITLEEMVVEGYVRKSEIDIAILDGSKHFLMFKTHHQEGEKSYIADRTCSVIEEGMLS